MSRSQEVGKKIMAVARERKLFPDALLQAYAAECILRRLSDTTLGQRLYVRGGKLWLLETRDMLRPTSDTDVVCPDGGLGNEPDTEGLFRDALTRSDFEDGFDLVSVKAGHAADVAPKGGVRLTITAKIGGMAVVSQLDVSNGGLYARGLRKMPFPNMFDDVGSSFEVNAHALELSFAEKFAALIESGASTIRLKDVYDLAYMVKLGKLDADLIREALEQTLRERNLTLPAMEQVELFDAYFVERNTKEFATRLKQWVGPDAKKGKDLPKLADFIEVIRGFVEQHELIPAHAPAPRSGI